MSNNTTDSTPINMTLPRLERAIRQLNYKFDTLTAKKENYSTQMNDINQSIERILNSRPVEQDYVIALQKRADKTTADVSELSNKVTPLLATFQDLRRLQDLETNLTNEQKEEILEGNIIILKNAFSRAAMNESGFKSDEKERIDKQVAKFKKDKGALTDEKYNTTINTINQSILDLIQDLNYYNSPKSVEIDDKRVTGVGFSNIPHSTLGTGYSGGRRIKKRTRRHKKKRGKKTRGKKMRATRTKH